MFDDLAVLRRRRSTKWVEHPPDVLPAFVAEMDVELAEPVRDALHEAIDLGDLGYTEAGGLLDACAAFMGRRFGWAPDPARMQIVPDVMAGIVEVLRALLAPGDGVVDRPRRSIPPFFDGHPGGGLPRSSRCRSPPASSTSTGIERAFAGGARALLLCNPHNPTGRVLARERAGGRGRARRAPRCARRRRRDPRAADPAGRAPHAVRRARRSRSVVLDVGVEGVQPRRAEVRDRDRGLRRDRGQLAARLPDELRYRAGMLGVIGSQAAFEHGDAWLDDLSRGSTRTGACWPRCSRSGCPRSATAPPEASFLAWLDCRALGLGDDPAAAFLERGRVALVPGPRLRRAGPRVRPPEPRDLRGADHRGRRPDGRRDPRARRRRRVRRTAGLPQLLHLRRLEPPVAAEREVAEPQRAEGDALEPHDRMPDGLEHPPHLALAALAGGRARRARA